MKASKIALGGLIAVLVVVAVGFFTGSNYTPSAEPAANQSILALDPVTGLAPIEDSIALWARRSDREPLDYLSRTQLGAALITQAREQADLETFEQAEDVLRDALAINPRYAPAKLQLAATLRSQHQFVDALALATEVVDTDPTSLSALALAGDANFELGNYAEAASLYAELEASERSAPVVSRLARLASVQGDNALAVALAEEALELSDSLALRPSGAAFYEFQLGHFRFVAGDVAGAVDVLTSAQLTAPGDPGSAEALAAIYAATGDLDASAELYEQLLASGPAADLHGSYADVLRAMGQAQLAEEHERLGLALAEETRDRFPAERRHLAGFYFSRDPETALALAEADLAERHDVDAYDTVAWALFHNGRNREASEAIDRALAQGTRTSPILYHAGAIAAALGDDERAISYLSDALAINPQFDATDGPAAVALLEQLTTR